MSVLSASVPDTAAQQRAAGRAARGRRTRCACSVCGSPTRDAGLCNQCRESRAETLRKKYPAASRQVLSARAGEEAEDCECGRPRPAAAPCCAACSWLDGVTKYGDDTLYVSLMRERGPMTLAEMASATGRDPASVLRTMHRMRRSGRVRRWWVENDRARDELVYFLTAG